MESVLEHSGFIENVSLYSGNEFYLVNVPFDIVLRNTCPRIKYPVKERM